MVGFVWGVPAPTNVSKAKDPNLVDLRAAAAEFVAMMLFVIIGCGVACGNGAFDPASRLLVAFAFGMGILVLAYAIGSHSGGQINCAVTLSLVLGRQLSIIQGVMNLFAQLAGSMAGAGILAAIFPCNVDMTRGLGTNRIDTDKFDVWQALLGEAVMTFLLCYVVFETVVSPHEDTPNAVIAIGFAVFAAHLVLLPIDGCSINPTRSFGPAIVSMLKDCEDPYAVHADGLNHLWVMWVGPLLGAALAAIVQYPFLRMGHHGKKDDDKFDSAVI